MRTLGEINANERFEMEALYCARFIEDELKKNWGTSQISRKGRN
jgi:hypothetical protein